MQKAEAFTKLEQGVYAALETYSNVHRGCGHNSIITTYLFEKARNIVLEYLGLKKSKYVVIFCSPRSETTLIEKLNSENFQSVSSKENGP